MGLGWLRLGLGLALGLACMSAMSAMTTITATATITSIKAITALAATLGYNWLQLATIVIRAITQLLGIGMIPITRTLQ